MFMLRSNVGDLKSQVYFSFLPINTDWGDRALRLRWFRHNVCIPSRIKISRQLSLNACLFTGNCHTVKPRNFEITWVDIPVTSISFESSRIILLYIQCKWNCLARYSVFRYFQSLDVNSQSQNHFHVKRNAWLAVNLTTLISRSAKSSLITEKRLSLKTDWSIMACVKRAQTYQRLIIDDRVTIAFD